MIVKPLYSLLFTVFAEESCYTFFYKCAIFIIYYMMMKIDALISTFN